MAKYEIARRLSGKRVITNRGEVLGKLLDLLVDEKSGVIEYLVVEIAPDSKVARKLGFEKRVVEVPYKAVVAVSDYVILDEASLRE